MSDTAWYGRAAGADTATIQLHQQHQTCRRLLPDGQDYTACYFDIGTGNPYPETRPRATPQTLTRKVGLPCAGGMADLLTNAADPQRRFHQVVCLSLDRISRRTDVVSHVLDALNALNVELVIATADGLPLPWSVSQLTATRAALTPTRAAPRTRTTGEAAAPPRRGCR